MSNRRFVTKGLVFAFSILAISAAASAQEKRIEINPFFGYTFSDGVTVDPFLLGGTVYDSINPMSGMSYGVQFGVFATENAEIGFLWSRQDSKLEAKGASSLEITDMNVDNYHVLFTYNWGEEDTTARPFLFGGLGATQSRRLRSKGPKARAARPSSRAPGAEASRSTPARASDSPRRPAGLRATSRATPKASGAGTTATW
jgi:hypothetical protein